MSRTGILGGMFDPIHQGHADAATAAASTLGLTRVLVVPASIPPHRPQPFASSFHRFAMVAFAAASRPGWHASDMELSTEAPSYTSSTLRTLHQHGHAPSDLFFIIGADAFLEIETWKDYPSILDFAHFVVVSRPGCPASALPDRLAGLRQRMVTAPFDEGLSSQPSIILLDAQTTDVSSTAIRAKCANGEPLTGLVDAAVEQHIDRHGLYRFPHEPSRSTQQPPHTAAGRLHGQSPFRES